MIAKRENGKAEMVRFGSSTDNAPEPTAQSKLKSLNQLTVRLLREVQSLTEVHTASLD